MAVVALAVGAVGGAVAGFELGASYGVNQTHRVLGPLSTAAASQAYVVLSLLEKNEAARVRKLLEGEIDSGLMTLNALKVNERQDPGDPQVILYERLRDYRETHPANTPAQ